MSALDRDRRRFLLQVSLSFTNRLEAPVWLRQDLYKEFGHEAPISGNHIARERAAAQKKMPPAVAPAEGVETPND